MRKLIAVPARSQSPIAVVTGPGVEQLRFSRNALPTTPRHQRQYRGATLCMI